MKVVFYVSTSIVLLLFIFSFIAQNPHEIKIYYYVGTVWDGPITTLLILTLGVGMLFGVLASGLGVLKLKIRLLKVGKQLRALQAIHPLGRENLDKEGN